MDDLFQILVLEHLVALKRDDVDRRVFDHLDDQGTIRGHDLHVAEQAGVEQALDRGVQVARSDFAVRRQLHIGQDSRSLDPAIALDDDPRRRLSQRHNPLISC